MSSVASPKILRPSDFAPTMTTPLRVSGSSDLIRPLNSMSQPSVAETIAGCDNRTAYRVTAPGSPDHAEANRPHAHREHAVGDYVRQSGELGDVLVPVNQVGVAATPA